jgi:hypothetical protein
MESKQSRTMSMIFQLRMLFGGDDEMLRDYELPYDASLLDFHRFICGDLGYDPMSMASFFTSNERWEQLREFTLMDMGAPDDDQSPVAMERAVLGQLLRQNHDRLLYQFDPLSARAMFIELMGTAKSTPDVAYPRIVRSEGAVPAQFEAGTEASAASFFDEAMDDFFDFDGDDLYEEEFQGAVSDY